MTDEPLHARAAREHATRREAFAAEARRHDARSLRVSMVRLALFAAFVVLAGSGLARGSYAFLGAAAGALAAFFVAVVAHSRVVRAKDRAETRRDIHDRHLARMRGDTKGLYDGGDLFDARHPYASDIDLAGPGSLYARIAVSHTRRGRETLAQWLGEPSDRETIRERQEAVRELAADLELRQELEAAVLDTGREALDGRPFLSFVETPPFVLARPWLRVVAVVVPVVTIALYALAPALVPSSTWLVSAIVGGVIVWWAERAVGPRYALLAARIRFVESFAALLRTVEAARWEAPLLRELQARLRTDGAPPSQRIRELELWTSLFELRTQGLIHVPIDALLFWDVHVLARIERWVAHSGKRVAAWLDVLGEVEALASLATLLAQDPAAILPEIADGDASLEAEGFAHPLLPPATRVANDLTLSGPGTGLLVTGSNMAGKSTLLRAVGSSVALALAGGPVCARRFRVPLVRLRASMRIADSLQAGASYFQAELARLRIVIGDADEEPPLLFLLDELLRGTNARARHRGARAVVLHLLARGATGIVATHDIALSELEDELDGRVRNLHFTDVYEGGEMTFDYRLRPGVVRTSNALRLLRMAGVDVEPDDALEDPIAAAGPASVARPAET